MLARLLTLLKFRDVDVDRMHLDILNDGDNGTITMVTSTPSASSAAQRFLLLKP